MKRFAIILLPLLLLGCSDRTGADQVTKIQEATVKVCGFLPTASSVAAILSAGNPAVTGVTAIAQAICDAVNRPTQRSADQPCPQVNGVCVEGEFVPKDQTKP